MSTASEIIDLTRLSNDGNGNARHVVHFLSLLTADEIASRFLAWADLRYDIALMRAATMGGRRHHTKAFGGGVRFQEQESLMPRIITQAFESFENSKVFHDAHAQIELRVINDAQLHGAAIEAMRAALAGKILPRAAFAEIIAQCEIAGKRSKARMKSASVWLGAVFVAIRLEQSIKEGA